MEAYTPDPQPASPKQCDFIRSLVNQLDRSNRRSAPKLLEIKEKIAKATFWAALDKQSASQLIDDLLRVKG